MSRPRGVSLLRFEEQTPMEIEEKNLKMQRYNHELMTQIKENKRKKEVHMQKQKLEEEQEELRIAREREQIQKRRAESRLKRNNKINQISGQQYAHVLEPSKVWVYGYRILCGCVLL